MSSSSRSLPDEAIKEYHRQQRERQVECEREQAAAKAAKQAREQEVSDADSRARRERIARMREIWHQRDPVRKYMNRATRAIETDANVQVKILDRMREHGETTIYFSGTDWPIGEFSRYVRYRDVLDSEEREALDYQIHYDANLERAYVIREGPFAYDWQFEPFKGWLSPGFRLRKRGYFSRLLWPRG